MNGGFRVRGTAIHAPACGTVEVLEDAVVRVDETGAIAEIAEANTPEHGAALAAADGSLISLGSDQVLLPGLVDLHVHAPQWPQMGKGLHLPLERWLRECTFPLEARYADMAFAEASYASVVDALIANGTTTAVYFATIHMEASLRLAEICRERGQRAFVGKVVMDARDQCPDYYRDASTEAALAETAIFIERVQGGSRDGLVRPIVTPRFIPSCTDAALEGLGALAREHGCHIQTHCSESDWEHAHVVDRLGRTDTEALDGFGLLTRHTVLAHANHVTAGNMRMIADRGAGIAHCPVSNFYFANAAFPLRKALDMKLHVGLGTDISGGTSASILENCRAAVAASGSLEDGIDPARPARRRGRPGSRIDFAAAFHLATAGGGEVLDLKVGRFAPGYRFDAIAVDVAGADSNIVIQDDADTGEDVLQKIVYGACRQDIRRVWIDGREVVNKGRRD